MNKNTLKFIGWGLIVYGFIDMILWKCCDINATPFLPDAISSFSVVIFVLLGGFLIRKSRGE